MKVVSSLKSGFQRALKVKKGVLIVWFSLFMLVLVFVYPLRQSLSLAFGDSMITEDLAEAINPEVFVDLGPVFNTLTTFLKGGFFFVILAGFLLNAFLTGGLFGSIGKDMVKFSSRKFFSEGSGNFWSFLVISLMMSLITVVLLLILLGLPAGLLSLSEPLSEKNIFIAILTGSFVFLLILPYLLLVSDFARSAKAANDSMRPFKALGTGFSLASSSLRSSYPVMLIVLLVQLIVGLIIVVLMPGWKPVTGGGVFLLLILSQLLLYIRLFLKTWRYASVTAMMELIDVDKEAVMTGPSVPPDQPVEITFPSTEISE